MKFSYALIAGGLIAALPVRAVYAPIPEEEQGKELSVSARAGMSYDSNIFGGASGAISSTIWQLAPRIAYNASVTDQTFVSAVYGLNLDAFSDRPGRKLLDSHDLTLRGAHAFSPSRTVDLNNTLTVSRNPESLLNGVPLNTDQSFTREQFDGRFVTSLTPKIGAEAKLRVVNTDYWNATLGRSLDRIENLYGLAANYAILPEVKGVLELRHLDVYYWTQGEAKNKTSEYAMAGVDYEAAKKLTVSARIGAEWRDRARESNTTGPYAEISGRYQFAERSFLTGGYAYTIDESSDPLRFTDQKVNRFFVNVQHALTALIIGSVAVDYEPTVLQGRHALGFADIDETPLRTGAALTYTPRKNWSISATYDFDRVTSDDPSRQVVRHRVGLSASYVF